MTVSDQREWVEQDGGEPLVLGEDDEAAVTARQALRMYDVGPGAVVRRIQGEIAQKLADLDVSDPEAALEEAQEIMAHELTLIWTVFELLEDDADAAA
jgi:hypothetical protein